jgi:quinol monooxygenase YgiN
MSAPDRIYCLNVTLFVKEDRREEFLNCIAANQTGTLSSEPNCLQYAWGEDESTRNTFHFHEQYVNKEGFHEHTRTKHFADWEKFAGTEPFTQAPVVRFFYVESTGRKQ